MVNIRAVRKLASLGNLPETISLVPGTFFRSFYKDGLYDMARSDAEKSRYASPVDISIY